MDALRASDPRMFVTLKGHDAREVRSIEEAVKVCAWFRDNADDGFGIGASKYYGWKVGRVSLGDRFIAQIHYNGRVESFEKGE